MNLPLALAWRYLKRPADKLISAVGIASLVGLIIGVMALVISMALMTGYRSDLQNKLLGGNAEIFVYSVSGGIEDTGQVVRTVGSVKGVREAAPVVFQSALIVSEIHGTGEQIMIKGVDPRRGRTTPLLQKIIGPGQTFVLQDGTPGVSLGVYLAQKLGVKPGSAVSLTVPRQKNDSFLPATGNFVVTNVYETGFHEFDARWVFLDFGEAQRLLDTTEANLIEVKLTPEADLDSLVRTIANRTDNRFSVTDWRQMNRQLFSLLKIQQLVLFIVIGLIVIVSTFNIVSTLIMTVHEKRREIGMLISMGADGNFIRKVFVWYGTLVGVVGTLAGIGLGMAVSYILTRYKLVSFGPEIAEVYFVSSIPFVTRWQDVATIGVFAISISFLSTLFPSMRAARLNPIDALRHE